MVKDTDIYRGRSLFDKCEEHKDVEDGFLQHQREKHSGLEFGALAMKCKEHCILEPKALIVCSFSRTYWNPKFKVCNFSFQ
mmetsp:Transcript_103210/g.188342  ORF Transcript_103210/g.188342 Transcript_103210/m.188342 type:complete len:81 (-) Transcript_103210:39-281(-)